MEHFMLKKDEVKRISPIFIYSGWMELGFFCGVENVSSCKVRIAK